MSNLNPSFKLADECKNPPYNRYNLTNRVLIQQSDESSQQNSKKNVTYYCPTYLRIKVKNFSEMSLQNLSSTINLVMIVTVRFNNIPERIQEQIKKRMVLRFNRDSALALGGASQEISTSKDRDGQYSFVIRKLLHAGMKANIFLSPFEVINLILTVNVQRIFISKQKIREILREIKDSLDEANKELNKLKTEKANGKQIQSKEIDQQQKQIKQIEKQLEYMGNINKVDVQFNNMDFPNNFVKVGYSSQGTFGNYDLAQNLLGVQYTNQELPDLIKDKDDPNIDLNKNYALERPFQYAHFLIPLYKFPFVTLFTIFIPLWLLGIINLGIFFQDTGLGDRIGSLSALMIAFVALIPVIREQLPPSPKITFVQILVYFETCTTLFCFIQSIIVRGDDTYQFVPLENGFFLVSVIIGLFEIAVILGLMLIHQCIWLRSYNRHVSEIEQITFNPDNWFNQQCDNHFRRKLDTDNIRILKPFVGQLAKIMADNESKKQGKKKENKQDKKDGKKQEKKEDNKVQKKEQKKEQKKQQKKEQKIEDTKSNKKDAKK